MAQEQAVTWLTQEAFDRLSRELDTLSVQGREEIAMKIEIAREEGDLKENGGYHAAKEEQGKIEARIRQLTQLLRTAEVGDAPESHGVVEPGTVVTALIAGDETKFLLGNREIAGRQRPRRLQRAVAARRRHHRLGGRAEGRVHRAERPRDPRRDPGRGELHTVGRAAR